MKEVDIDFLLVIKDKLISASNQGYVRGAVKAESKKLRELLKDSGVNITPYSNLGCGSCILKLYKKGYEVYNQYLK